MQTLDELMAWARTHVMSPEEKEAQRRSFTFGNAHLANPTITRALVDEVADKHPAPDVHPPCSEVPAQQKPTKRSWGSSPP